MLFSIMSVVASCSASAMSLAVTTVAHTPSGKGFLVAAVHLVTAGDDAGDDRFVGQPDADHGVLHGFLLGSDAAAAAGPRALSGRGGGRHGARGTAGRYGCPVLLRPGSGRAHVQAGGFAEFGQVVSIRVGIGLARGEIGEDPIGDPQHRLSALLDQVHVAVGPAHQLRVAVCGGFEPEGLADDVRDAFRFGLPPAPVQVLPDAGAGEVVAADVRQLFSALTMAAACSDVRQGGCRSLCVLLTPVTVPAGCIRAPVYGFRSVVRYAPTYRTSTCPLAGYACLHGLLIGFAK